MNQGWQCPGCGRGYAPWMSNCTECKPKPISSTTANPSPGRCQQQDLHDPHEWRRWGTTFWCDGRGDTALVAQGRCSLIYNDQRCALYATHAAKGVPHRFIFERPVGGVTIS